MKEFLILDYQDNFIDNLACYACADVIKNQNHSLQLAYENSTSKRQIFENKMKEFNLKYDYISTSKVDAISKKSYNFSRKLAHKFEKENKLPEKIDESFVLGSMKLKIDNLNLFKNELFKKYQFKNLDFVMNYDILDKIKAENSIGLFLSTDLRESDFIESATKRLNKYLKKPKLFIFAHSDDFEIKSYINYEIIDLADEKEIFYFLQMCRHNIIPPSENNFSYLFNLLASLISKRRNKRKRKRNNNPTNSKSRTPKRKN